MTTTAAAGPDVRDQIGVGDRPLVDVDLDDATARALAPDWLPMTDCTFGRISAPGSHRLYVTTGDPGRTRRYSGVQGEVLVELRGRGDEPWIGRRLQLVGPRGQVPVGADGPQSVGRDAAAHQPLWGKHP